MRHLLKLPFDFSDDAREVLINGPHHARVKALLACTDLTCEEISEGTGYSLDYVKLISGEVLYPVEFVVCDDKGNPREDPETKKLMTDTRWVRDRPRVKRQRLYRSDGPCYSKVS